MTGPRLAIRNNEKEMKKIKKRGVRTTGPK
jgi:hypothetical protein